ncbi:MAG: NADH-quinone oxidoreductase subunit L [Bacteriovoracaceae bacterium]|jgi:NADH-quinone oxidoreductase subunit L|nr:NADH-quinone oxidoreductase subunit L [Bacteriovoracaceae bacterium]
MDYTIGTVAPILLFPLAAFVINAFIGRKLPRQGDWVSIIGILLSFGWSARIFNDFVFGHYSSDYYVHKVFTWIDLSYGDFPFQIDLGIYIDNMTAMMLLMVSGVAALIHIFSSFYMKGDPRYGRFFTYLSLFTTGMLGLVLSENLLSVFIFWELMGFCSYSLIGFYYEKEEAGNASMKAFMTTRVGDVCFLLAILGIWSVVGSVSFVDIYNHLASGAFEGQVAILGIPLASFCAFMIFAGTIGKSAQFPLQVWLPDAMMGPTPCSALIHAATMVAAGVYLSLRMYPLMEAGHLTTFIAYIGAITAFGAATIALIQTDIKAVLAYSTISQLGYMVLGIGVGSYNAAFMHLITHAVFKACLFLSAGSVIHSLHDHHTHGHVQEMPRMGGLRKKMPYTFLAMACCTLAISGVPFFSGFVSKDRILGDALYWGITGHHAHWYQAIPPILGFAAAFLTAFYMCRMMFLTFFGEPRDKELYEHCHKEKLSLNRNIPLLLLAVFTLGVWYSGSLTGQGKVKVAGDRYEWFSTLIEKPNTSNFREYTKEPFGLKDTRGTVHFEKSHYDPSHGLSEEEAHHVHTAHNIGAGLSILVAFLGIFIAFLMYIRKSMDPGFWVRTFHRWNKALKEKYYFDHLYIDVLIQKVLLTVNRLLAAFDMGVYDRFAIDGMASVNRWLYKAANFFDNFIVDNSVDLTGVSVKFLNVASRTVQSGKVQFYFMVLILAVSFYILKISF